MFQPGARDAAVPIEHGPVDRQSWTASERSLRMPPPADGRGRGERAIAGAGEPTNPLQGERSRFPPALRWPRLPDEAQGGQPDTERSPWPELPDELMIVEPERWPTIHSGDAWRHERLEREQRGELWNA
jgi:hypothetical protein